jgi:hypothetical protein
MRNLPASWITKAVALTLIVASVATLAVFAADRPTRKKKSYMRLDMGCDGKPRMHCTRDSFEAAVAQLATQQPENTYKLRHYSKDPHQLPSVKGALANPCSEGHPTGIHSTQSVQFNDVETMKAFSARLVYEEP